MIVAKFLVLALSAILAVCLVGSTFDEIIAGHPMVIDGQTLEFSSMTVRLQGIEAPTFEQNCGAPEQRWPCGAYAMVALLVATRGKVVWCLEKGRGSGLILARCYVGFADLARTLVESGWAVPVSRSSARFSKELAAAIAGRRGQWR